MPAGWRCRWQRLGEKRGRLGDANVVLGRDTAGLAGREGGGTMVHAGREHVDDHAGGVAMPLASARREARAPGLLDAGGEVIQEGVVETTEPGLAALVKELASEGEIVAGQEVGTMSYFVHDVLVAAGTKLLSFNPAQLRMIAASRKKT